ncbi:DUF2812 domain-containing protein [Massilia niabensis]|uniref:DUF2812 domain-containing protein n=1 Tax=Massilia niabensis TaxID=544910 RepID=A0ABW0L6Q8_9BURK
MSAQLVTKFKFFWDDADHAIERWLEDMARQGLHLHKMGLLHYHFVFRRGEPAEMTYRIDFRMMRPSPDYLQLFSDAGWEHAGQSLGWQIWRAPSYAGRTPEIFTDVESRIKKYQRLLWLFALAWSPALVLLPFERGQAMWDTPQDIGRMLAGLGFTAYVVTRLVRRIRKLRNPVP